MYELDNNFEDSNKKHVSRSKSYQWQSDQCTANIAKNQIKHKHIGCTGNQNFCIQLDFGFRSSNISRHTHNQTYMNSQNIKMKCYCEIFFVRNKCPKGQNYCSDRSRYVTKTDCKDNGVTQGVVLKGTLKKRPRRGRGGVTTERQESLFSSNSKKKSHSISSRASRATFASYMCQCFCSLRAGDLFSRRALKVLEL